MGQLAKFKPVFMAVGAILVLWAVYTFGGSIDFTAGAVKHAEEIEAQTLEIEQTIVAQLERLQRVKLETRLFETEGFRGLKDWSVPLGDPDVGRNDPFASLSTAEE